MRFINVGKDVALNVDEIMFLSPVRSLETKELERATDLSSGTKRSAVICKNGRIYLVDLRLDTLKKRLLTD